uniref:Uncharacterized protein n=1 Tax=Molossus molossus TaxID=27622 RepID=A0A7J8GR51_MOLMO|nr:hypothetical protein HJG59_011317 [Molossus molossus]
MQPDLSRAPGTRSQFQSSQGAQASGRPVRCSDVPRSAGILPGAVEAAGGAEGAGGTSICLPRTQFSGLYEIGILYPSMKAIARRTEKEDKFEECVVISPSILPPEGASEIEIKTQQITFRTDHLEACLLSLGCDVMARERSSFESYSVCYEHLSEHVRQKLRQKEQELDILRSGQSPPEDNAGQEQLWALEQEHCGLAALVCRVRGWGRCRLAGQQAPFWGQLSRAQKEATRSKSIWTSSEWQENAFISSGVTGAGAGPGQGSGWQHRMCEQLDSQLYPGPNGGPPASSSLLCAKKLPFSCPLSFPCHGLIAERVRTQVDQEALHRQQLDSPKTCRMEKLLEAVEQKEQHLQLLPEEAERAAQRGQLQREKTQREL